jgi:zinc/manganese transport system substrate-binding protein
MTMIIVIDMTERDRLFRRTIAVAAVTAVTAVLAAGCGSPDAPGTTPATAPLAVVATTPQVADFVRILGGAGVTVHQIIKPGVDPHEYEPTPADMRAIGAAELVVENGVGIEKWLGPTISAAGYRGPVVDASQGVGLRHGDEGDDPHIWHNPRNAKIMVRDIAAGLAAADPARSADFTRNLAGYSARLDRLDAGNVAAFATLPAARRKLVTDHDAFGYYVDRYQLQFVGSVIPSMDTSAELSARRLTDLVARIRATGCRAGAGRGLPSRPASR